MNSRLRRRAAEASDSKWKPSVMDKLVTTETEDEEFYRNTESVAFPELDDRQLAMLEPLGARRIGGGAKCGQSGHRDVGLTVVLRGTDGL